MTLKSTSLAQTCPLCSRPRWRLEERFTLVQLAKFKSDGLWAPQTQHVWSKIHGLPSQNWSSRSFSPKPGFLWYKCGVRAIRSHGRASLVAQWLGVCLLVRGTRVRALVQEGPTCRGATGPMGHGCWACASGACALQQGGPQWWEAHMPRWGVAPARRGWREPSHRGEDPTKNK